MKFIVFISIIFIFPSARKATAEIHFSENVKLYLLTTNPGKSIDQSWGHSSIWFVDILNNIDYVFEYTSTEKNKYLSMIQLLIGKDIYRLRVTNLETYQAEVPDQDQIISYRLISNDKSEIEVIYLGLINELKQKTKHIYTLSSTNCSSLIFDHIQQLCKNDIKILDKSIRDIFRSDGHLTFWQKFFVVDILLSSIADKNLSPLNPITPRYLESLFHDEPKQNIGIKHHFDYLNIILINFLAVVLLAVCIPEVYLKAFLLCTGLAGIVLTFIFILTDEPLLRYNHQISWLNPLNLLVSVTPAKFKNTCLLVITLTLFMSIIISLKNGHLSIPLFTVCSSLILGNVIILKKTFQQRKILNISSN